jgi:hypothetical protein
MPWSTTPGTAPVYRTKRHRDARATLVRNFRPGDPCCLCSLPMWPPTRDLHADHCPTCLGAGCDACAGNLVSGYRGLSHGSCNVRDGARRGRARQGLTPPVW